MGKITAIGTLCSVAILAGVASADSISYSELTPGQQVVTGLLADGSAKATAYSNYSTATLGKFSEFSLLGLNPVAGVGGSIRIGDPLISGTEAIVFDFAKAVFVDRLDVAFLYKGVFLLPDETAKFTVKYADNTTGSFVLKPTSLTTASYTGPASDLDSELLGIFGGWDLTNPFGKGRAVSQIAMEAGSRSDFGFEQMCVTPVPLPAAIWGGLTLMGAFGVNAARKRRLVA